MKIKLNPIISTIKDKRVVVVDDSIVRGTTSARIVKVLREAGAKEVHMMVSAPPFVNACYYGTDIDSPESLIANNHTLEEMRQIIDVDTLGFLSLEHVKLLTGKDTGFCTACFDNQYPTAIPKEGCKSRFEQKISEGKGKQEKN